MQTHILYRTIKHLIDRADKIEHLVYVYDNIIRQKRLTLYGGKFYFLYLTCFICSSVALSTVPEYIGFIGFLILFWLSLFIPTYRKFKNKTDKLSKLFWDKYFDLSLDASPITLREMIHLPEPHDFAVTTTSFGDDTILWGYTGHYKGSSRHLKYYTFTHKFTTIDESGCLVKGIWNTRYGILIDRFLLPALRNTTISNFPYKGYLMDVTFNDDIFDKVFYCSTNSPNIVRYLDHNIRGALMDIHHTLKDSHIVMNINDKGELAITINKPLVKYKERNNVVTTKPDRIIEELCSPLDHKVLSRLCNYASLLLGEKSEKKPCHLNLVR